MAMTVEEIIKRIETEGLIKIIAEAAKLYGNDSQSELYGIYVNALQQVSNDFNVATKGQNDRYLISEAMLKDPEGAMQVLSTPEYRKALAYEDAFGSWFLKPGVINQVISMSPGFGESFVQEMLEIDPFSMCQRLSLGGLEFPGQDKTIPNKLFNSITLANLKRSAGEHHPISVLNDVEYIPPKFATMIPDLIKISIAHHPNDLSGQPMAYIQSRMNHIIKKFPELAIHRAELLQALESPPARKTDVAEKHVDQCKEHASTLADTGLPWDGYKLDVTVWADTPVKAIALMQRINNYRSVNGIRQTGFHLDQPDRYAPVMLVVTPGTIEAFSSKYRMQDLGNLIQGKALDKISADAPNCPYSAAYSEQHAVPGDPAKNAALLHIQDSGLNAEAKSIVVAMVNNNFNAAITTEADLTLA